MLQLQPNETFPIVRVLEDHTDASTNYVQAVIRDATTDAILKTVQLTDKGSRRFQTTWKVPYDNVWALGRYVLITTTVYTDSGYTTKNANYGEIGETYLVQQRWNQNIYTGAGGEAVDYKAITKILQDELAKLPKAEFIDYTARFQGIEAAVQQAHSTVAALKIPEPKDPVPVDLSPVHKRLDTLTTEVRTKQKMDAGAFITELRNLHDSIAAQIHNGYVGMVASSSQKSLNDMVKALADEAVQKMQEIVAPIADENKRLKAILATGMPESPDTAKKNHLRGLAIKHGIKL